MRSTLTPWLLEHPGSTALQAATALELPLRNVSACLSLWHQRGQVTAESIWINIKPAVRKAVLHYSLKVKK